MMKVKHFLCLLKIGDMVVYAKYSGTDLKDDEDEDYLLLSEKDILAILNKIMGYYKYNNNI